MNTTLVGYIAHCYYAEFDDKRERAENAILSGGVFLNQSSEPTRNVNYTLHAGDRILFWITSTEYSLRTFANELP